MDRIVNADSDALIGACESRLRSLEAAKVEAKEKIAKCGRPLADFDKTYRTAKAAIHFTIFNGLGYEDSEKSEMVPEEDSQWLSM